MTTPNVRCTCTGTCHPETVERTRRGHLAHYALASRYGMASFRLCVYPMPVHGPAQWRSEWRGSERVWTCVTTRA